MAAKKTSRFLVVLVSYKYPCPLFDTYDPPPFDLVSRADFRFCFTAVCRSTSPLPWNRQSCLPPSLAARETTLNSTTRQQESFIHVLCVRKALKSRLLVSWYPSFGREGGVLVRQLLFIYFIVLIAGDGCLWGRFWKGA